jgi:hypothetical protein
MAMPFCNFLKDFNYRVLTDVKFGILAFANKSLSLGDRNFEAKPKNSNILIKAKVGSGR